MRFYKNENSLQQIPPNLIFCMILYLLLLIFSHVKRQYTCWPAFKTQTCYNSLLSKWYCAVPHMGRYPSPFRVLTSRSLPWRVNRSGIFRSSVLQSLAQSSSKMLPFLNNFMSLSCLFPQITLKSCNSTWSTWQRWVTEICGVTN